MRSALERAWKIRNKSSFRIKHDRRRFYDSKCQLIDKENIKVLEGIKQVMVQTSNWKAWNGTWKTWPLEDRLCKINHWEITFICILSTWAFCWLISLPISIAIFRRFPIMPDTSCKLLSISSSRASFVMLKMMLIGCSNQFIFMVHQFSDTVMRQTKWVKRPYETSSKYNRKCTQTMRAKE